MLDFWERENTWSPPELSMDIIKKCTEEVKDTEENYLAIFKIKPYIDTLFIPKEYHQSMDTRLLHRFVFYKEYAWTVIEEKTFSIRCLNNERLSYTHIAIDEIYKYYSMKYPDWKLKRYWTKGIRVLDHIYHCERLGTVKEILYKAGLDELAANIDDLDEVNLLSSKPSDVYDGVSIRALRALNCRYGSFLLAKTDNRILIKDLMIKFPDTFDETLNDAQCRYIHHLIEMELTVGEIGRLFRARRRNLAGMWIDSQYHMFLHKQKIEEERKRNIELLGCIDPIYKEYLSPEPENSYYLENVCCYLLQKREEYDNQIRRSNRRRNYEWQERDNGYVVRYPQTVNDFCREAVFMSNCLLGYVDAFAYNDTTIMLMREEKAINKPFITIEIDHGELMQAYHRFNKDCTEKEAEWIREYCNRHNIVCNEFSFDADVDRLF